MREQYYAHIVYHDSNTDHIEKQTLVEHSFSVAKYTSQALESCGLSSCGYLIGLLHDMGKARGAFQEYIEKSASYDAFNRGFIAQPDYVEPKRGSVIHTFQGCDYLLDFCHDGEDQFSIITSEMLACAIASHHGFFDCKSVDGKSGFDKRIKYNRDTLEFEECVAFFENEILGRNQFQILFEKAKNEMQQFMSKLYQNTERLWNERDHKREPANYIWFEISLCIRMLTSALMYADRRDTAEFFDGQDYSDVDPNWKNDIQVFEEKYQSFTQESVLDRTRKDISDQCVQFAKIPSGIYRMNVPTGGGKTLSSLRYALYHAERYKKERIIFVIPLLSILDQNAQVIKEYLPEETVLEHHSDVITENMNEHELNEYDLLLDRWSAPVIITTMVRVLDVLFSAKTGDATRMRALSNSVIVFDEVQTVPNKMASLFTGALNYLAEFCNVDIILSSATQPAFEHTIYPLSISSKRMVQLTNDERRCFVRHQYHLLNSGRSLFLEDIAEKALQMVTEQAPLMIVCNTKNEALKTFQYLSKKRTDIKLLHLSAGMCKAHRKKVIAETKRLLKNIQSGYESKRFILVTTQIVEAGVDLSFQTVIRLEAGDDNLVQAAGRCNRSHEYDSGEVYMARVKNERNHLRNLPDICEAQIAMDNTINLCSDENNFQPEQMDFIRKYYEILYVRLQSNNKGSTLFPFEKNGMSYSIGGLLSNELKEDRDNYFLCQAFLTAGKSFKVFDDNTYTVLVPYEDGEQLINTIKESYAYKGICPVQLLKKTPDYSVQIYEWQKNLLLEHGMLYDLTQERNIRTQSMESLFAVDLQAYNSLYGIDVETEYNVSDMIL